jgi:hypothetical protein
MQMRICEDMFSIVTQKDGMSLIYLDSSTDVMQHTVIDRTLWLKSA